MQTFTLTLHKEIDKDLKSLEQTVNAELNNLYDCLMTNEWIWMQKIKSCYFSPPTKENHYRNK